MTTFAQALRAQVPDFDGDPAEAFFRCLQPCMRKGGRPRAKYPIAIEAQDIVQTGRGVPTAPVSEHLRGVRQHAQEQRDLEVLGRCEEQIERDAADVDYFGYMGDLHARRARDTSA